MLFFSIVYCFRNSFNLPCGRWISARIIATWTIEWRSKHWRQVPSVSKPFPCSFGDSMKVSMNCCLLGGFVFNVRVGYLALILTCFFCKVSFFDGFLYGLVVEPTLSEKYMLVKLGNHLPQVSRGENKKCVKHFQTTSWCADPKPRGSLPSSLAPALPSTKHIKVKFIIHLNNVNKKMRKLLWYKSSHNTFEWLPKHYEHFDYCKPPPFKQLHGFSELADDEKHRANSLGSQGSRGSWGFHASSLRLRLVDPPPKRWDTFE